VTSSPTARHTRVIAGAVIVVALGAITAGCGGNKTTNPSTTTTPSTTTATTTASTTAPAPSAPSPSGPAPSQNNINPTGGNQFTPVAPANPPTAQYPHTRTPY
jgi:hypothetical protein